MILPIVMYCLGKRTRYVSRFSAILANGSAIGVFQLTRADDEETRTLVEVET